jgi:hypothetical protein
MILDIIKSSKLNQNHKLYLITGLNIPFFFNYSVDDQNKILGISVRSIYRIREDLKNIKILKDYGYSDIDVDKVKLRSYIK